MYNDATEANYATTGARAVCQDHFSKRYSNKGVNLYLTFTIVFPLLIMTVLAPIIQSSRKEIHKIIVSSPQNYSTFAGVTIASAYLLIFIFCMDCAALHFYLNNDKLESYPFSTEKKYNLSVVAVTFGLDLFMVLHFILCLTSLSCIANENDYCNDDKEDCCGENGRCTTNSCLKISLPCCCMPYFYVFFGRHLQKYLWTKNIKQEEKNARNIGVVSSLMIAPLFSLASHVGYILIAWVTEPAKTTAFFLVALGSFLFLFFFFRQCYKAHNQDNEELCRQCCTEQSTTANNDGNCCRNTCLLRNNWCLFFPIFIVIPLLVLISHLWSVCCYYAEWRCQESPADYKNIQDSDQESGSPRVTHSETPKELPQCTEREFNVRSFLISFSWGSFAIGYLAFIFAAFYLVPPSTTELVEYIEALIQIIFVVLGSLITYKFLIVEDSDILKFAQSFRKVFKKKRDNKDDIEALGEIAGEELNCSLK